MEFTCKKCEGNHLEEIMVDVCVASQINSIDEEGFLEYGFQSNDGGEIDRYQCMDCGEVVKDSDGNTIKDCLELADYLVEQAEIQRRDEKHGLYPDKEDIAN